MKTLEKRPSLLWLFTALLVLASFVLDILAPHILINSGYLNWVFVAIALVFFVKNKPRANIKNQSELKPFILISLLQFSLIAIFYGITQFSGVWLVTYSTAQADLFNHTLQQLWWRFGLFPWPITAVFTVLLNRQPQNQDIYPHQLLPTFFNASSENAWGLFINTATRAAIALILSVMIAFTAMAILCNIAPNTTRAFLGFQPVVLIMLIGLLAFLASKNGADLWRKIATHRFFSSYLIWPTLIIVLCLFLFICLAIASVFTSNAQSILPLIAQLAQNSWLSFWLITALCCWWLISLPTAVWLTQLLKNTSERCQIIYILFWPILWCVSLILVKNWHFSLNNHRIFDTVILFVGAVGLSFFIARNPIWQTTIRGYIMHENRDRPATKLIRNVGIISLIVLYIFWQSSVVGLTIPLLLVTIPCVFLTIAALASFP